MKVTHLAILAAATGVMFAAKAPQRLNDAADVITDIMSAPDKGIPQDLLDKSECIVIIPGMKKGAFILGAKYGKGFISCRKSGLGWSAPGSVRVEGGSIGFQAGGSETDVVMLIMNQRGGKKLLESKFTVGGDASAAAGPVGRTSSAETDAQMHAEILTYSRARGLFAGISLQGATLRPDDDWNREIYGRDIRNKEAVFGDTPAPPSAARFLSTLNKYSSRH